MPPPASDKGILLLNLGSPEAPTRRALRRYLNEFLMDSYVINLPYLLRRLLVLGIILPFRSSSSAAKYQKIWRPDGSPLISISNSIRNKLQEKVAMPVQLAMRYGRPAIAESLEKLLNQSSKKLREILLMPLYPHYALSTTATAVAAVKRALQQINADVRLEVLPPFYDDPDYIEALVAGAAEYLSWDYDHLLFSYHGLPEKQLAQADPTGSHCLQVKDCCHRDSPARAFCYRAQVFATTAAFADRANIGEDKYSISFQSRLWGAWLQPYTRDEITRLGANGIKKLLVICPAFVTDCLETLEEIGLRAQELFINGGGDELRLIPCLNDQPQWINILRQWCDTPPKPSHLKSG
ncbi:ferrochelatase [Planctomycetota bacterium]